MNLEQLYFIAEIIAAIAMVLSLLYLGFQIKRSRIQSENDAMDTLSNGRTNYLRILSENTELSFIVSKGLSSKSELTANERFRFMNFIYVLFVGFETAFWKWKRRDIDDKLWQGWHQSSQWWLRFPSVRLWWKHNLIGGFTDEFSTLINAMITNINNEDPKYFEKQLAFMEEAGKKQN